MTGIPNGCLCAWEQTLTAGASLGAEQEDVVHLQKKCPPWPMLQQAALIPSSIPARLPHGHCGDQVTVCCNAQLAPSPLQGAHSSEIFILAPWETLNCFNLSEYFTPHLANGSAGVGDVLASVPSETSSKKCQVSVPQACLLTGAVTPACPTM